MRLYDLGLHRMMGLHQTMIARLRNESNESNSVQYSLTCRMFSASEES